VVGGREGGRRTRVSCETQKLRDHMTYNFRTQLVKVCVARQRGTGFGHRLRVRKNQERGLVGSVARQITLGRYRIGILMSRVKRGNFVLNRD